MQCIAIRNIVIKKVNIHLYSTKKSPMKARNLVVASSLALERQNLNSKLREMKLKDHDFCVVKFLRMT